jgi:hypothetical protein
MAAQKISISGVARRTLTTGDPAIVSRVRFQVTGASSLAMDVQGTMGLPGNPTYVDLVYQNVGTGAEVTAGTDITADGIYEVDASGMTIALLPTAGVAQVTYVVLLG